MFSCKFKKGKQSMLDLNRLNAKMETKKENTPISSLDAEKIELIVL